MARQIKRTEQSKLKEIIRRIDGQKKMLSESVQKGNLSKHLGLIEQ